MARTEGYTGNATTEMNRLVLDSVLQAHDTDFRGAVKSGKFGRKWNIVGLFRKLISPSHTNGANTKKYDSFMNVRDRNDNFLTIKRLGANSNSHMRSIRKVELACQ